MRHPAVINALLSMTATAIVAAPLSVFATPGAYDVYVSARSFQWEEYDSDGSRLLKESGPLVGVGGAGRWEINSLTLQAAGEVFLGQVDYDGQTFAGTPVQTDSNYLGYKLEGAVGYKIKLAENAFIEPFAGPTVMYWERELESTAASIGYLEKWTNIYARFGLAGKVVFSDRFEIFGQAGIKAPLYNENRVDFFDVTLKPGREEAYFAGAGFQWAKLKTAIFYEGLRFSRSAAERGLLQPESEGDIFGLNIGWSF